MSALVWSWRNAQRATEKTPTTATPRVNRICNLLRNGMPALGGEQDVAQAEREAGHPGGDAGRHHHQPERGNAETRDQACGDQLAGRVERGEKAKRQAEPDHGAGQHFADQERLRHLATRAADIGDRLVARQLHGDEIDQPDSADPAKQRPPNRPGPSTMPAISKAAMTLAMAKNGASWARAISWASRSGEPLSGALGLVSASDSPPGRRAETIRLYRSGASYIRYPLNCWSEPD